MKHAPGRQPPGSIQPQTWPARLRRTGVISVLRLSRLAALVAVGAADSQTGKYSDAVESVRASASSC